MNSKETLPYAQLRPDAIFLKCQQESKHLHSFSAFLQAIRKDLERFTASLHKASSTFKASLSPPNDWSDTARTLLSQYEVFAGELSKCTGSLGGLIQPLEEFAGKYEVYSRQVVQEASRMIEEIAAEKRRIEGARKKYFKEEKSMLGAKSEESYRNKMGAVEELRKEYKELVMEFNRTIESKKEKYVKLFKTWNKNEDVRVCYIKKIFESFHNLFHDFNPVWEELYAKTMNTVRSIPELIKVANYVDRSVKEDLFQSVSFELPKNIADSLRENEKILDKYFPDGVKEVEMEFVSNKIKELSNDQTISDTDKDKLFSLVKSFDGLYAVCDQLININSKVEIENVENFNTIKDLAKIILNQLVLQKFPDSGCLLSILILGSSVVLIKEQKYGLNKYLREELASHPVWRHKNTWAKILDYKIAKSLDSLNTYIKQSNAPNEKSSNSPIFNKERQKEDKKAGKRGIYFNEISFIVYEMAMYSIDKAKCRELAIEYSNKCDLEFNKVYQMLSDCESAQVVPREENPSHKEVFRYSLQKREKERKKYGYSKATIVLGVSIKFVFDLKTLGNVLLVSRDWNSIFKGKVYRLALKHHGDTVRFSIWKLILHNQGMESLYSKLKAHSESSFSETSKGLEEIIKLDVMRSFSTYSESDRNSIISILRSYSILNSEVEYCQGMNYIAGFFFFLYRDEATAFDMLCGLISNFGLSDLFKHDVPLLRVYFYQLNRFIAIFLPRIHLHLYKEGINATFFSSSWFLTVFTYVLQSTEDFKPPLLLLIFDGFLSKGVNSLFKTALFILEYFEERLLKADCDNIALILNDIQKSGFFYSEEVVQKYKERVKRYNITEELLDRLNDEYVEIFTISEKRKIVPCEPRTPFKHYIRSENPEESPLISAYLAS
eukprot:TRINITY_DN11945_c0_g1_i8.p1 TRINITY_DN11945_c0_g1~~TRINITY_DN11945_c0_g1_i8.p1  ORF type:complete len:892 (-),score=268.52 TRINITY_DN11945_c0_g1_i8:130-2805(-)